MSFICYADMNSMKLGEENDQLVVIGIVDLAEFIKALRNKVGNADKITLEQTTNYHILILFVYYEIGLCFLKKKLKKKKERKDWFVGAEFGLFLNICINIFFSSSKQHDFGICWRFSVIIQKLGS